jgi:hypothetical protein
MICSYGAQGRQREKREKKVRQRKDSCGYRYEAKITLTKEIK